MEQGLYLMNTGNNQKVTEGPLCAAMRCALQRGPTSEKALSGLWDSSSADGVASAWASVFSPSVNKLVGRRSCEEVWFGLCHRPGCFLPWSGHAVPQLSPDAGPSGREAVPSADFETPHVTPSPWGRRRNPTRKRALFTYSYWDFAT